MVIWPFQIRDTFIESIEWLTDVIRSKNNEQRFAMRQKPLTTYNFVHFFTVEQYNAAKSLIRQNDVFLVPDWSLSTYIGALSSGSDSFEFNNEDYLGIHDGDRVLIWESPSKYESTIVEATYIIDSATDSFSNDSAGSFYDSSFDIPVTFTFIVQDNYTNARLIPLHNARAPNGLRPTRQAGNIVNAQIAFELTDSEDIGQSSYPRYRGHDLINDCPTIASESFDESIFYPVDAFSDDIGFPVYLDQRNTFDNKTVMRWHLFTKEDIYTLRQFLHSRKGRWKAFWLSTYARDFEIYQDIGVTDAAIIVYAPNDITDLGYTTFDIDINGQYSRHVTSYSIHTTTANGRKLLRLNIDSELGVAVSKSVRLSYLYFMRFDSDRVEFNHAAQAGASVAIPCIELNEL